MRIIPENFLQFIWKYKLFNESSLNSEIGRVEVLDTGLHNSGSGPDFFNARIRINGTVWAGNIEVHTRASDWFRHGHDKDPAYSNVILHVVQIRDCTMERPGGEIIPTVEVDFDANLYEKFSDLIKTGEKIPCVKSISGIPGIYISEWMSRLMIERLEEKTASVHEKLTENKYHWEETLYQLIGKAFGFMVNGFPFEILARTTPLLILQKYRERPLMINAILFGQAGFLEDLISDDDYYVALQKEYRSINSTLPSRILGKHTWKFKGSRPANFPPVRIAQFASLVINKYPLFSKMIDDFKLESWQKMLDPNVDKYWENHYLFGKPVKKKKIMMGKDAINLIILNAVIPVLFSYASYKNRNDMKDGLLAILENLPPEKNTITGKWAGCGIPASNAFESQSLIHLSKRYCFKRRCLECLIGQKIIRL